jgi:hypothetical protein
MSGFAHRWFSVGFIFLLMVASGQTSAQLRLVPSDASGQSEDRPGQIATGCSFMYRQEDLETCRQLADAGDTQAMLTLAEGYARGHFIPLHPFVTIPKRSA